MAEKADLTTHVEILLVCISVSEKENTPDRCCLSSICASEVSNSLREIKVTAYDAASVCSHFATLTLRRRATANSSRFLGPGAALH